MIVKNVEIMIDSCITLFTVASILPTPANILAIGTSRTRKSATKMIIKIYRRH